MDDVTSPLPYETGTFDFVRMRFMILGLKKEQWPTVVDELARILKVGGYLELSEPHGTGVHTDCEAFLEFMRLVNASISGRGGDPDIGIHLRDHLSNSKYLSNTQDQYVLIPYGRNKDDPYLDTLAKLACEDIWGAAKALKAPVVGSGMVKAEDYADLQTRLQEEMSKCQGGTRFYIAYARRI